MAIDTSALVSQATADNLIAEYQRLATELETLPLVDVSDLGRSINSSTSRKALQEEMDKLWLKIVKISGPVFKLSRMRA